MSVHRSTSLSLNSSKGNQFKYLGPVISSDGRSNTENASRIAQAKKEFSENEINTNK